MFCVLVLGDALFCCLGDVNMPLNVTDLASYQRLAQALCNYLKSNIKQFSGLDLLTFRGFGGGCMFGSSVLRTLNLDRNKDVTKSILGYTSSLRAVTHDTTRILNSLLLYCQA